MEERAAPEPAPHGMPQAKVERLVVVDGVLSRLMDAWTGGVFLVGLGLLTGASTTVLGILASMPFLAQVAQLPAVQILVRVHDRRRIVILAAIAGRTLLAVVAVLVLQHWLTTGLLVLLVALMAVAAVIATAAWNSWMRELIEPARLGRFFAGRLQVTTILGALAILGGGWFLDSWSVGHDAAQGYTVLFALGAVAGLLGVLVLARTPNAAPPVDAAAARPKAGRLVWQVIAAHGNRPMMLALSLLATGMTVALPFTGVYLLRSLGYSFFAVAAMALANQLAYVAGLRVWGVLSDRHGNRPVMHIAGVLLGAVLVGWAVAWSGVGFTAYLALLHVATGLAVGGLELTTGNLLLKLAPRHNTPAFLAGFSLVRAAMAGTATILAGVLWEAMGQAPIFAGRIAGVAWQFRPFQVLALVSAALAFLALLAIARVAEPGVAPVPDVVRAMRREVLSISTLGGFRSFMHTASYLVETVRTGRRRKGPPEPKRPTPADKPP